MAEGLALLAVLDGLFDGPAAEADGAGGVVHAPERDTLEADLEALMKITDELPRLHPVVLPIARGDTLLFATDGVREGFAEGLPPEATPQQLADQILARHGKGTDDALVLVARYLGGTGPRE